MSSNKSHSGLDEKPPDEKQIGFTAPIDFAIVDAPTVLELSHAAEYAEFLRLKEHFESNPKAYKALVRRRMFSINVTFTQSWAFR